MSIHGDRINRDSLGIPSVRPHSRFIPLMLNSSVVEMFDSPKRFEPRLIRNLRGIQVQCLAAGHVCSGVVDEDGCVYTWGSNAFWQLGYPSHNHIVSQPLQAQKPIPSSFERVCRRYRDWSMDINSSWEGVIQCVS